MSASPVPATAVPTQKRPLEDPSSEAGITDQHDAKRPALDNDRESETLDPAAKNELPAKQEDTIDGAVEDNVAAEDNSGEAQDTGLTGTTKVEDIEPKLEDYDTQPIQSTTHTNGANAGHGPTPNQHQDESQWLHMRAIISSAEAATVIGKGGENVSLIRRMSGAKCTVSDYTRGAVERVLTVSGLVDAVAKAFGLIIRTLNNEPHEAPSNAQSKTYPLRLLIPHILIGSIIGQKGIRIREIQEASGARLNASESALPLSTERSLVVLGVADAVHIATYYVGSTLVEQLTERFGGPAASAYATRSGGPAGAVPGGLQVVPYVPQAAGGQWGEQDSYRRHPTQQGQQRMPNNAYGGVQAHYGGYQQGSPQYGAAPARPQQGYPSPNPQMQQPYGQPNQMPMQGGAQPGMNPAAAAGPGGAARALPGQQLTQQIYIPNDMVGAIIGKGGAKINEIRQLSGSVIKINEPQDNSNERLVTISGTEPANQMALYMLYQRLGESKPMP